MAQLRALIRGEIRFQSSRRPTTPSSKPPRSCDQAGDHRFRRSPWPDSIPDRARDLAPTTRVALIRDHPCLFAGVRQKSGNLRIISGESGREDGRAGRNRETESPGHARRRLRETPRREDQGRSLRFGVRNARGWPGGGRWQRPAEDSDASGSEKGSRESGRRRTTPSAAFWRRSARSKRVQGLSLNAGTRSQPQG